MGWQAVSAIGGIVTLVCTVLGSLLMLAHNTGKHTERLNQHQRDIEKLQETADEHTRALGAWDTALRLLEEVREDVKGLLTGAHPRSPRRGEG
jgi:hypothetical protein